MTATGLPRNDEALHMQDQVFIVTGAASGVGADVVRVLRAAGARVVGVDLHAGAQDEANDAGMASVQGDVADPATATAAVALALRRFGRVDGLVNNAARFLLKPLLQTEPAEWDALFAVNVRSVMLFCRAALPAFIQQRRGAIVNLASISGLVGLQGQVAYGATKGAIVTLTKALAIEHAHDGVRVNSVAPGAIDTGFVRSAVPMNDADYAAVAGQIAAAHPLGRMAQPIEVAKAVRYLLSPEAAFITGVVLPVDGGWTAQ
jgi:NAD(P)-dependent dehydrogenase (short-subunit alcohol dehydrogenase family)